jgi:hypothetical protein
MADEWCMKCHCPAGIGFCDGCLALDSDRIAGALVGLAGAPSRVLTPDDRVILRRASAALATLAGRPDLVPSIADDPDPDEPRHFLRDALAECRDEIRSILLRPGGTNDAHDPVDGSPTPLAAAIAERDQLADVIARARAVLDATGDVPGLVDASGKLRGISRSDLAAQVMSACIGLGTLRKILAEAEPADPVRAGG